MSWRVTGKWGEEITPVYNSKKFGLKVVFFHYPSRAAAPPIALGSYPIITACCLSAPTRQDVSRSRYVRIRRSKPCVTTNWCHTDSMQISRLFLSQTGFGDLWSREPQRRKVRAGGGGELCDVSASRGLGAGSSFSSARLWQDVISVYSPRKT